MRLATVTALSLASALIRAEVLVEVGKNTGLKTWEWKHQGISLRLVQRLPDQTRAYAMSRGLPADLVDELATSCFFGSMFRNDGVKPLDFDLTRWQVKVKERAMSMRTREYWAERFAQADVTTAARVGLNWSLMPTRQHFEPGDYNWGMTVYGLPPGSVFDLHLNLRLDGQPYTAVIPGLECAPEEITSEKTKRN